MKLPENFNIDTVKYAYEELRAKALETRSEEDVNALGEWFEAHGNGRFWNGECHDADGFDLFPIYEEIDEDMWEIVRWEMR